MTVIQFTPLEALLVGAVISVVSGLLVRVRCVGPKECAEHRRDTEEAFMRLAESLDGLKKSIDIQFRMLRAIVPYLDLPASEKAKILNMGPTK